MRRVLMVSPHFPPDTSAAAHRVRLLAPHLSRYGWEPTVVSIDPRDYEGRLDPDLASLVPPSLRVVRTRAWPARWTRCVGLGDLGLRSLQGLHRTCRRLLISEHYDALFITTYPTYSALLGPILKRRFRVPFILDYQDLWVGAWGLTVGGGPNGKRDLKSQLTRTLAMRMEPYVAAAADAITAVSKETYEGIRARNPDLRQKLCEEIPLGGEPADFAYLRSVKKTNPYFDPNDGNFHLCYVGTLLPLGVETLGTFLRAVALLRDRRADLYAKLRLRFFGTSNQTRADASQRVLPMACNIGIADCVSEIAPRIDYLDALTVLTQATGILMMGSNEKHYTASKLYPGLLAKRPILAIYHQSSSVVNILGACACAPTARLVTYSDLDRVEDRQEAIYKELLALLENPYYDPAAVNTRELQEFSSEALAGKLAGVLDRVQKQ